MPARVRIRRLLLLLFATTVVLSLGASPVEGALLRRLDYETGNLEQWTSVQAEPGRIGIVKRPIRQGRFAARFVVEQGDAPVGKGERTEVFARTGEREGTTSRWRWSTLFPKRFRPSRGSWNVFVQWHHTGSVRGCGPPVLFRILTGSRPPRLQLSVSGGTLDKSRCEALSSRKWTFARLRRGVWYDFEFFVRWSASRRSGSVGLLLNGRRVIRRTPAATLYRGYGVYVKQGFYRQPADHRTVVVHDGMQRLRP